MKQQGDIDLRRRRLLTAGAAVVGGTGTLFAAVPFVKSWTPSAKAQAAGAPVEVDISQLEPGAKATVEWRRQPVWIVHRTPEMLDALPSLNDKLRDPDSEESVQPPFATNISRAARPEILVMIGVCTHLGCSPTYRPEVAAADLGSDWRGGFFCPCHGSKFDLAGRVYQGVPAPLNMVIPPYTYLSETRILIGESPQEES